MHTCSNKFIFNKYFLVDNVIIQQLLLIRILYPYTYILWFFTHSFRRQNTFHLEKKKKLKPPFPADDKLKIINTMELLKIQRNINLAEINFLS